MNLKLGISAAAVTLLLSGLVFAQEESSEKDKEGKVDHLQVITVRGTKEGTSYVETRGSVSVLKESELPGSGRENNLTILNAIPNLEVNKNKEGESFSIRGINNTGVTGYQKDNLSSIVIDDLFQTDLAIQSGSFDVWDMDQVEVLRGAQSTSQGINSLAGTILLDHNRPVSANEGILKLGAGNFGHKEFGALTNNAVGEKLSTRISYNKEMNDGFIKNKTTGNDKWGAWDKDRVRLALDYKIRETQTLSLETKFHQNRQGGTYTQSTNPFDDVVYEDLDYETQTANYQVVASYKSKLKEYFNNDFILGYSIATQNHSSDADQMAQNTAGRRFENHDDQFLSLENRLLYDDQRLRYLLGVHAHQLHMVDDYSFNLLFPLGGGLSTPVAAVQGMDREQRAYAIFQSMNYKFDDVQSLGLGLRAEFVESRFGTNVQGRRLQDLGGGNATVDNYVSSISGEYKGDNESFVLLPKLEYGISTNPHYWGLTYARGYRTAGVGINRRRASAHEYEPEFTNNYELSYRYAQDGTKIGGNLFYIDWKDQQVQVQMSADTYDTQVVNAARSVVYGAEIEGQSEIGFYNTLGAGVGYSKTEFKNFISRNVDYGGNEFPFSSNWTGRISHTLKATETLSFMTVLRYVGKAYTNSENTRENDDQLYVNWNTKYAISSWVVEGYVNNIFDGRYHLYDGRPTSPTSPYQGTFHQVSTPREFGARLTQCF